MEVASVAIPFHQPIFPGFLQPKHMLFLKDSFQLFTQLCLQIVKIVTFTIPGRILNAPESGKNLLLLLEDMSKHLLVPLFYFGNKGLDSQVKGEIRLPIFSHKGVKILMLHPHEFKAKRSNLGVVR
ncbi:hypothetical protein AAHE18_05G200100 [Arachis hypogaea]